jgi:hypothetical protein
LLLEQGDDEHGVLAVDPGKLALAAAEDSALDAQLIEGITGLVTMWRPAALRR